MGALKDRSPATGAATQLAIAIRDGSPIPCEASSPGMDELRIEMLYLCGKSAALIGTSQGTPRSAQSSRDSTHDSHAKIAPERSRPVPIGTMTCGQVLDLRHQPPNLFPRHPPRRHRPGAEERPTPKRTRCVHGAPSSCIQQRARALDLGSATSPLLDLLVRKRQRPATQRQRTSPGSNPPLQQRQLDRRNVGLPPRHAEATAQRRGVARPPRHQGVGLDEQLFELGKKLRFGIASEGHTRRRTIFLGTAPV